MNLATDYSIEVVIPVHLGKVWIASCFESIRAQTLDRAKFRVSFVFNGDDDGAQATLYRLMDADPSLPVRVMNSLRRGASSARNLGIEGSEASHVTWIDVDDEVSPEYLDLLYRSIAPGVVPNAILVDVSMEGRVDAQGLITQDFLAQESPLCRPSGATRLLTYMVGKLLPIEWVRSQPLSERLDSGEDVAFYGALVLSQDFRLSLWPGAAGAIYYRRKVPGSVSRQEPSRDFMVRQRCDVIAQLSLALDSSRVPANEVVALGYMRSQASFIRRYLETHPEERQSVMDEISARNISRFPWNITVGVPRDLVVAYNFAPFTDTGATITSKRIREWGRPVDVISNHMGRTRESLEENSLLSAPYVARHHQLSTAPSFAHPNGIKDFVENGMRAFESLCQGGREYDRVYSRSMWPASHFLAARIKDRNPDIRWVAEFSDPVRLTTEGDIRRIDLEGTPLLESLKDLAEHEGMGDLLDEPDLFSWTELLPYFMADQLIFTNEHQLKTMLDYAPVGARELLQAKAVISVHPTLPRDFYSIGTARVPPSSKVNIGYFGDFYSTRGLHEVLEALRLLDRQEQDSLCLSVYTSRASSEVEDFVAGDLGNVLRSGPRISFLDFLATLDAFDVLIVNDAATAEHHVRNPYLPSKLSDYRGSKARIWAIAEPGSSLSSFPADFSSARGDSSGALRVLRDILHNPSDNQF